MNCKNCQTQLVEGDKFCPHCSAKVIDYRLNFKSMINEFFETYISWDNKFLKTLLHMFFKPEVVIKSYLSGVRKRYMQPFAFMFISLTLYGVMMYFFKDFFTEALDKMSANFNIKNSGVSNENTMKKINDFTMKNNNFITFLILPFFALINLLIFRKKNNFIEHNISVLYSYASYNYFSVLFIIIAILFKIPFTTLTIITYLFLLVYHMWFFKRLYQLSYWKILYKTLFFLFFISILFLGFIIVGSIIMFLTGNLGT